MFGFEVIATEPGSQARRGRLATPHGVVETPVFMPVGTKGTVKGLTPRQLQRTGTDILLSNTYHLLLRPGPAVVEDLGGLHRFMGWDGPILTDSGGFQVFSLADLVRIDNQGVTFRSHIDGNSFFLDPRAAMSIQNQLGADIIMALDQCPPYPVAPEELQKAVERTIAWASQCREFHRRDDQMLFGIVQGGLCRQMRARCAEALLTMEFSGYAIGGLSVGESHEQMVQVLDWLPDMLPPGRPRYLMGVGMPRDIIEAVRRGVDMFDCVLPTRNGRNSYAFTATGPLRLRNQQYKSSMAPIEADCDCDACTRFSVGYIRHLFLADEMLGPILASIHNIRFFQRLMARIRFLIENQTLGRIYDEYPVLK